MQSRLSRLVLLLACYLAPVCAISKFLASRTSQEVKLAKEHLRVGTARLAQALRQELGPETPIPVLVVAAQDLMGEEAGNLQHEDRAGAEFLRQYAQQLSPASFMLSPDEIALPVQLDVADASTSARVADSPATISPSVSSMSEETVLESDEQGHAVRSTTRCKDGLCVRETDVADRPSGKMRPTGLHKALTVGSDHSSTASNTRLTARDAATTAVRKTHNKKARQARKAAQKSAKARQAVHDMAKAMREMQKSFGDEGFDTILKNFLAVAQSNVHQGDSKHKQRGHSSEDLASSSSSTVIAGGRVVQERKECRNGTCTTSMEEQVISNSPEAITEHTTSEQKEHVNNQESRVVSPRADASNQNEPNEIILVGANPPVVPW